MRGSACNPRWNARGPGWRPCSRHAVAWPLLPTPLRRKRLRVCCCKLAASPPLARRPPSLPRLLCKTRSSLRSSVRVVASLREGDGDSVPQTSDAALGPLRSVSLLPPRYRGSSSAHRRCRSFGAPWRGRAGLWPAFPSAGMRTAVRIPRFAAPLATASPSPRQKPEQVQVPGQQPDQSCTRTNQGGDSCFALGAPVANNNCWPSPPPVRSRRQACANRRKDAWAGDRGWSCGVASRRPFPPLTAAGRFWGQGWPQRAAQRPPAPEVQGWGLGLSGAPVAGKESSVTHGLVGLVGIGSAKSQRMRHRVGILLPFSSGGSREMNAMVAPKRSGPAVHQSMTTGMAGQILGKWGNKGNRGGRRVE